MSEPNTALQAVRSALLWSQDELARRVRAAGEQVGEPNDCSKRLVQRWESGEVTTPRGVYARALEVATGQPVQNLFPKGYSRREALGMAAASAAIPLSEVSGVQSGPLTGIWHSRYEYVSSGRGGKTFASEHYVVLLHRGHHVQVRSLPHTAEGVVQMELTLKDGNRVTGTWVEQTDKSGYYAGSTYDGAIQMLIDPTGHRMSGQWVGFTRDFETQTGPWSLSLVTADTGKEAMAAYNRPVTEAS